MPGSQKRIRLVSNIDLIWRCCLVKTVYSFHGIPLHPANPSRGNGLIPESIQTSEWYFLLYTYDHYRKPRPPNSFIFFRRITSVYYFEVNDMLIRFLAINQVCNNCREKNIPFFTETKFLHQKFLIFFWVTKNSFEFVIL